MLDAICQSCGHVMHGSGSISAGVNCSVCRVVRRCADLRDTPDDCVQMPQMPHSVIFVNEDQKYDLKLWGGGNNIDKVIITTTVIRPLEYPT